MTNQIKRGEVWLANLNPTQGSEQAGIRPVIKICLITGTLHPTITTFLPQYPHLIQNIMTGLQRTILEA